MIMDGGKWNFLPYTHVDGVPTMRDSDIKFLYDKCFEEGIGEILFHDGKISNAEQFIDHMTSTLVMFWAVYYEGKPFGFYWLNRIDTTHAYCHFTCYPEFWGTELTVEAGKRAMKICTKFFPTIMGMLPSENTFAIDYLKRVGLNIVGEVPNLMWSQTTGKPCKGTMLYITKEMLDESLD
jgi:hypothetical protein